MQCLHISYFAIVQCFAVLCSALQCIAVYVQHSSRNSPAYCGLGPCLCLHYYCQVGPHHLICPRRRDQQSFSFAKLQRKCPATRTRSLSGRICFEGGFINQNTQVRRRHCVRHVNRHLTFKCLLAGNAFIVEDCSAKSGNGDSTMKCEQASKAACANEALSHCAEHTLLGA